MYKPVKVDIVIPLYNKSKTIKNAIDSVLQQSYQCWQLYIIDDGSTDGSSDIAKEYSRHDKISYCHQVNSGPGAARNLGLNLGNSPFVAFLDADDIWLPSFLEVALNALEAYPDAKAFVSSWYREGLDSDISVNHKKQGIYSGLWKCPLDLPQYKLKLHIDFCHSSAIILPRSIVEYLGGYFDWEYCTYGEDSWLWLQLLLNFPIYRYVKPLINFRSEFSELGYGRVSAYPLPPVLKFEKEYILKFDQETLPTVKKYLDWYSILVARRMNYQGEKNMARKIFINRLFNKNSLKYKTKICYELMCTLDM